MKKLMRLMVALTIVLFSTNTFAEELGLKLSSFAAPKKSKSDDGKAFEGKGSKTLLVGLGGSNMFTIFSKSSNVYDEDFGFGSYSPISGGISVDGEFGIHKYVGIGFHTGIFGARNIYGGFGFASRILDLDFDDSYAGIYIPVGIIANFHFYQLIEDKTSKDIHGDKLDLYVGANLGSGVALAILKKKYVDSFTSNEDKVIPGALVYGGIQFGVKYFPKPKLGIFAELGYGKTFANGGVCFKL
jgi:hypothetical protein